MIKSTEILPERPSLEKIRGRLIPSTESAPMSMPTSSRPIPEDLLKEYYPRIHQEDKTTHLQLSESESIQVDPNDDGGHDTQLTYPRNLLLQLAHLKKRKKLSTMDLADLLRISSLLNPR